VAKLAFLHQLVGAASPTRAKAASRARSHKWNPFRRTRSGAL
jgi:hypothetical protein